MTRNNQDNEPCGEASAPEDRVEAAVGAEASSVATEAPSGVGGRPAFLREPGPASAGRLALMGASGLLLLAMAVLPLDPAALWETMDQAREFFLSTYFLFFCLSGLIFAQGWIKGTARETLVIGAAFTGLFLFYGPYPNPIRIAGDNLCQIAYWNLFFRPHLAGSNGASFTKPGQIAVLGPLFELAGMGGEAGAAIFSAGICLVMAGCVWTLARVAEDIGGRPAGLLAFVVTPWAFLDDFLFAEATIFLAPVLFLGLRWYFFVPARRAWGRLLLILSLQFHIQAVAVPGIVWLILLARRDWRELRIFSLWLAGSIAVFVGVVWRIQGDLARLNSGAAAGYVAPLLDPTDPGLMDDKFRYMWVTFRDSWATIAYIHLLLVLTVLGAAGAAAAGAGSYLATLGVLVILAINVLALGGELNLGRYFGCIYAFACSVGCGVLVWLVRSAGRRRDAAGWAVGLVWVAVCAVFFDFGRMNLHRTIDTSDINPIVIQGTRLLQDEVLPESPRLMTEDDLLYVIMTRDPDRFPGLAALQAFNVASEERRREILARTDYIWFDLAEQSYYYLLHIPLGKEEEWGNDPFRLMVQDMMMTGAETVMYGVRFIPVDLNEARFIVRVEPDGEDVQ